MIFRRSSGSYRFVDAKPCSILAITDSPVPRWENMHVSTMVMSTRRVCEWRIVHLTQFDSASRSHTELYLMDASVAMGMVISNAPDRRLPPMVMETDLIVPAPLIKVPFVGLLGSNPL